MTEHYSLSSDFNDGLESDKLEREISSSSIVSSLVGITTYLDDVAITFDPSLSLDDKSTLDTIVAQHVPDPPVSGNKFSLTVIRGTTMSEYELICAFPVNDQYSINMQKITVVSKLGGSISSYSIRVYDVTNNTVIAEATFSNNEFDILDMGSLSNIPTTAAMFEIHAKKTGGDELDKVTISEISIYGN